MKNFKFIGLLIGFILPILILSFVKWDLFFIKTIGEWEDLSRLFFLVIEIAFSIAFYFDTERYFK